MVHHWGHGPTQGSQELLEPAHSHQESNVVCKREVPPQGSTDPGHAGQVLVLSLCVPSVHDLPESPCTCSSLLQGTFLMRRRTPPGPCSRLLYALVPGVGPPPPVQFSKLKGTSAVLASDDHRKNGRSGTESTDSTPLLHRV